MVRPIMRDPLFLSVKSEPAAKEDMQTAQDLLDTLRANLEGCVGMAANMIGVRKRIIAVSMGFALTAMINPVIVSRSGRYETQEGCLSLAGVRRAVRYERIEVEYLDMAMRPQRGRFEGFTAQIIQHEIDHCDGILI